MDPTQTDTPQDPSTAPQDDAEATTFVPLEKAKRAPTTPGQPSEATNLATLFSEDEQKKIAATVCMDYDADVKSREERMRRIKEFYGLYASVMKPKNFPFQNAANINLPILTYPMLQVQGRLFDMIWPSNGKILYAAPTSLDDVARANTAETFANAYIRQKMPGMSQGIDDTLHQVCIAGSAFRRTYWNAYEGRACSDWIPLEDFVVAHSMPCKDPSMRDVPRYTMVQHLTYYDIEGYGAQGVYANTEKVKPERPEAPNESPLVGQLKKIDGVTDSDESTEEDKPRFVLEQHRIWRMPNRPGDHPSFDGKPHAVIVTVDDMTETVLSVVVREEPDPTDFSRHTNEAAAHDQHTQALATHAADHEAASAVVSIAQEHGRELPSNFKVPVPPEPPPGVKIDETGVPIPPTPQRMREICFFTHYRAFPSDGFYGLGFGDFLAGLNKATNTLTNQHIDGVTIRNAPPGFISANMKGQRGTLELRPGVLTEVDAPSGNLADGIAWVQAPPNDPTTMPLIELLMGLGDKLVASSDLMSGQTSGANRTAKETQILAEQMMMQITVLARRIKEAFRHELDKIWRLFGVFLPDEEIVSIVGDQGDPQTMTVSKDLFRPDAHVNPAADPRTKTQRVDETTALYQMVTANPYIQQELPPPQKTALMEAVTEDLFRALGGDKFIKFVKQPPPPPPGPPPARPYWAEDADFLRGKDSQPNAQDDDQQHIEGHSAALSSPAGAMMDKVGKDMAEKHIRMHMANKIEKSGMALMHQGAPVGPAGGAPQPQQQAGA